MNWKGVTPAITTPFNQNLTVDHGFLAEHCRWLLDNGCAGIVALGSLGEGATLSFNEKVTVLQIMDATDSLKPLAGILPAFVAYICYSEASVLDRATHTITGPPVGWTLSNYEGVTDGFDEFRGYFENRRSAN